MSNNLDRHIAVVGHGSTSALFVAIAGFDCTPRFFEPSNIAEIRAAEFDALVIDDVEIKSTSAIEKILRDLSFEFKPIAVVGRSTELVREIFGPSVELAVERKTSDDDFVSDRDFKILSTTGTDKSGITRMMRELIEMA